MRIKNSKVVSQHRGTTKIASLIATVVILSSVSSVSYGQQEAVSARDVDIPVIDRPVSAVSNFEYDDQHIPVMRTSKDGRLALSMRGVAERDGSARFSLNTPERITTQFHESEHGAQIMAHTPTLYPVADIFPNRENLNPHITFCEVTNGRGEIQNPYACGQDDCYDIKVIGAERPGGNRLRGEDLRLLEAPATVRIRNPKTANARIVDIQFGRHRASRHLFEGIGVIFEPIVADDGHLFIGRAAHARWTFNNEAQRRQVTGNFDMMYIAGSRDPAMACNVDQWSEMKPLAHAPYDRDINTRYGFAMQPFRDAMGNVIPDNIEMSASYPWVDHNADNIGFMGINTRIEDETLTVECLRGQNNCGNTGLTRGNNTLQGKTIMGLWTNGKQVLADGMLNHTDYGATAVDDEGHRIVSMYRPDSLNGRGDGKVRIGGGRDVGVHADLFGDSGNTSFLDSVENKFNFWENLKPVTPRDIVWHMSTGVTTDEFAFDDYLFTEGFIISSMVQATQDNPQTTVASQFNGFGGAPTRVQNGATSTRWNIPSHGNLHGSRIERAALGGLHGKGAWLTGRSYIHYGVGAQPRNVRANDWHISMFVDARYNDNGVKSLITFPDGSELQMVGRNRVRYRLGNSNIREFTLPQAIPNTGWAHLGVQMTDGNRTAEFYHNGFLLNRFTHNQPFFEMTQGSLFVGSNQGNSGFRGWIDDFKVIAHHSGDESWCNHANGTLAGISGNNREWSNVASGYPDFAHSDISTFLGRFQKPTFNSYVCFHDYSGDYAAHAGNIPASLTHVGADYNFPEGPLVNNQPRPESRNNEFCLACHTADGKQGLDLDALALQRNVNAIDDPRRQPLQPLPLVYGNIPANWLGQGRPARAMVAPADGIKIDQLLAGESVTGALAPSTTPPPPTSTPTPSTPGTNVVQIRKRNAQAFALDGNNGAANGQSVSLGTQNRNSVNQQWIEVNRGNGYFSYQKVGTDHCLDGGVGGANNQDVYLWRCNNDNQNQHWQKVSTDSGFYQLRKRNAPGFAINGGGRGADGQNVNLFDSSRTSHNLQWSIQ